VTITGGCYGGVVYGSVVRELRKIKKDVSQNNRSEGVICRLMTL
jgi:hypothetical protein